MNAKIECVKCKVVVASIEQIRFIVNGYCVRQTGRIFLTHNRRVMLGKMSLAGGNLCGKIVAICKTLDSKWFIQKHGKKWMRKG